MALGQPQDCVMASSSTQAGVTHVEHMLLVSVTVGQPVWVAEVAVTTGVTSE